MPSLKIHESDVSGNLLVTYVVTAETSPASKISSSIPTPTKTSRVDVIKPSAKTINSTLVSVTLINRLLIPFLPLGYPQSVTPDYTSYQAYDSVQAFASTIAGLLASRAVLVGLGVGSENASATAATLLSIAQESIGRGATIFFAHHFAARIESEVKFYRFLADIVNDVAFILDCMSPSLPTWFRIPALCAASGCRAVCGVCGGSSKAILSAHFAKTGNIGELNAKDGSQETVVSLLGMWAGGLLVSIISNDFTSWIWLIALLSCHLWANYKAVRSVRLRTLNRNRANMVLSSLLDGDDDIDFVKIGALEQLLPHGNRIYFQDKVVGSCTFSNVPNLLACMGAQATKVTAAYSSLSVSFEGLIQIFDKERYVLWTDIARSDSVVVLKSGAGNETQLRALCHAIKVARALRSHPSKGEASESMMSLIKTTLQQNQSEWETLRKKLNDAGWNLDATSLETRATTRVTMQPDV